MKNKEITPAVYMRTEAQLSEKSFVEQRTEFNEALVSSNSVINKKRIAIYARGITDESVNRQTELLQSDIAAMESAVLVGVYYDIGSKKQKKRCGFLKIISDSLAGKIDEIQITKIRRFTQSRYYFGVYIRKLTKAGVNVHFDNEGLDTLNPKHQVFLALMDKAAKEASEKQINKVKSL